MQINGNSMLPAKPTDDPQDADLKATTSRVLLAVRLASLCKETLTFKIHLTS
jgi:hypothetical protein